MQLLIDKKREALRQGILAMGERTTTALRQSLDALRRWDRDLARALVANDLDINSQRRLLEQQALVVLAAQQPAGRDLRLIAASLDMTAELERIADHAADVARLLLESECASLPQAPIEPIGTMGEMALTMLTRTLAVYGEDGPPDRAMAAIELEPEVDALEREAIQDITDWIREQPSATRLGIQLLWIAHHYERIADRTTNIAERLVYVGTGATPELNQS